jgi:hypothetical protein
MTLLNDQFLLLATVILRYVLVHNRLLLLRWENETNNRTTDADQHLEQSRLQEYMILMQLFPSSLITDTVEIAPICPLPVLAIPVYEVASISWLA